MTLYIASLFLPYTVDFEAAGARYGQSMQDGLSTPPSDKVEGQLADLRQESLPKVLSMTPGATTEHEKIFKPFYASQSASDEAQGPAPTENAMESWGSSRTFNQPISKAMNPPDSSILSRPSGADEAPSRLLQFDTDEPATPRVLLSDADWVVKSAVQGNRGLRNAVDAAVKSGIIQDKVWVGTLGMPTDALKEHTRTNISKQLDDHFGSLTVFVGDSEFEGHYFHFCRNFLYPAFHYQMQETPRHKEYDDHSWKQYVKVNEIFADTIAAKWKPGDRIWIHDYHLMLLPQMLRVRLPSAKIGFFMHTAFPSSEIFRCLTAREALLDGMLAANFVGLQTAEYVYHFLNTCHRVLRLEISVDGVRTPDQFVPVKAFPIGIDLDLINLQRSLPEVKEWVVKIRERYEGKHLIIARDRLDVAGGVKQKLLSYEKFLKRYPEWRDNVVLVQVATSSSPELSDLETQITKIAMRINSKYSTLTHQPLVLLKQDISFSQFLALLSVAEIFMITSLREGMNLAGHDFVACQDGNSGIPEKHGSLILSEFTGSASIWHGHKLLVNPWDYVQCADAIDRALTMLPEEKASNWEFLSQRMAQHTASMWCDSCLGALDQACETQSSAKTTRVPSIPVDAIKEAYNKSNSRIIIIEDNSLFPSLEEIGESIPIIDNERLSILQKLASDPKNTIYITSSRTTKKCELYSSDTSKIGLIAENGAFLREPGNTAVWQQLVSDEEQQNWRWGVQKVMEYFQERTEGAWIEERQFSLTFQYKDAVDKELAVRHAAELNDQINSLRGTTPIRSVLTDVAVTVESTNVTEATAAELVLQKASSGKDSISHSVLPLGLLLVAGGSCRSEALFKWANVVEENARVSSVISVASRGTQSVAAKFVDANESLISGLASLVA